MVPELKLGVIVLTNSGKPAERFSSVTNVDSRSVYEGSFGLIWVALYDGRRENSVRTRRGREVVKKGWCETECLLKTLAGAVGIRGPVIATPGTAM